MGLRSIAPSAQSLLETVTFRVLAVAALTFALFAGGLCVILDLPDEPTTSTMDALMCAVMAFFLIELALRCLADPQTYPLSGFFLMDVVGSVSMIFEVSFLLGHAGQMDVADTGVNAVLLRSARAARMATRLGRLSKLVRCMAYFTGRRMHKAAGAGQHARVLSRKLRMVLSTKVSILTVVLVLGVPLFSIGQYPQADLSMRAWSRRLEADYERTISDLVARNETAPSQASAFLASVGELLDFYREVDYFPYQLEGYPERPAVQGRVLVVRGAGLVQGEEPRRRENIMKQPVAQCAVARPGCEGAARAAILFDLTAAKRYNAAMDLAIIVFVVISLAVEACDLSQTVQHLVVRPIEKMLDTVFLVNDLLHQAAGQEGPTEGAGKRGEAVGSSETVLVERALEKLSRLVEVFMAEERLGKRELGALDTESRGVLVELLRQSRPGTPHEAPAPRLSNRSQSWGSMPLEPLGGSELEGLPAEPAQIMSWELDVLALEPPGQERVAFHVLFDSELGQRCGRPRTEAAALRLFVEAARRGYLENPYHCFAHACDTLCATARILQQVQCHLFLEELDVYALLVAALCHDIGHPGRTNPFLVETSDALALRYNDRSPLENLHCARLFDLLKEPARDVLRGLSREEYRRARGVCIVAILNTDNAQHFELVKEVKKVFEVDSGACNAQALEPEGPSGPYLTEVLCKNAPLWHKLFLHLADIGNPLKPFYIYMIWAQRVMDEFFAQGDEEKRLGIPVGMLNDREKVSRPGSEHGFITFLAAPLVTSTTSVFPALGPLARQMTSNLESWRNLWVQQAAPSPEDVQKRDADVQRIREQVELLIARGQLPSKAR